MSRLSCASLSWHQALGSPLLVSALVIAVFATLVAARAIGALQLAEHLRDQAQLELLHLASEQSAAAALASGRAVVELDAGGGMCASANAMLADGRIAVRARAGQTTAHFNCSVLAGQTPESFGHPLVAAEDLGPIPTGWPKPWRVSRAELPQPAVAGRSDVQLAARHPMLARDGGIALLRLLAGTDAEDYVLGRAAAGSEPQAWRRGGVVTVDGNLWVDRGGPPLELDLEEDLTIVVNGNLYLGRSLLLSGPGRLTLVTLAGTRAAPSPIEGTGEVFVGLPGAGLLAELQCDATIVVGSSLYVSAHRIVLRGSLVLGSGATIAEGCRGELDCSGWSAPDLGRSALPGFASTGTPRAGRLRPGYDSLYLAAPSR